MTGSDFGSAGRARLGRDLDAVRRYADEQAQFVSHGLLDALDGVDPSEDPVVTFARIVDASLPHLSDGCEISLQDGGRDVIVRRPTASARRDTRQAANTVVAPIKGPGQGEHLPYAGLISCWWTIRRPDDRDRVAVGLLARWGVALISHQRAATLHSGCDERAAQLTMQVITDRAINLALGVLMARHGLDESAAEQQLRSVARSSACSLYEAACDVLDTRPPDADRSVRSDNPSTGSRIRLVNDVDTLAGDPDER